MKEDPKQDNTNQKNCNAATLKSDKIYCKRKKITRNKKK